MWPWIGNLITALATISGVLLAQLVTIRIEKTKWRREEESRWLNKKQDAYADYMSAVLDMNTLTGKIQRNDEVPTEKECRDHEERINKRAQLVALLSPEMIDLADELKMATFHDQWLTMMAKDRKSVV